MREQPQPSSTEQVLKRLKIIGTNDPWPEALLDSVEVTGEQYCLSTQKLFLERGGVVTSFLVLCRRHPQGMHQQKCSVSVLLDPEVDPTRDVVDVCHRAVGAIIGSGKAAAVITLTECWMVFEPEENLPNVFGKTISRDPKRREAVVVTIETESELCSWVAPIERALVHTPTGPRRKLMPFIKVGVAIASTGPERFWPPKDQPCAG